MILVVFVNLFIWGDFFSGLFATGTAALRRSGTAEWASALFAQQTSVGWLCKEIIKIFRFRGSVGPALKATQAAGNNRNPPLKTFRTGLLPALYAFSVQCKCFCRTCAVLVLKTLTQMNILSARAVSFLTLRKKLTKNRARLFYFVLYWFFINLTKMLVGGILKKWKCPNIGLSPHLVNSRH